MIYDQLRRPLRDLRISVTDRCNFRCGYCMPNDRVYRFLPKRELLTFEELARAARAFAELGVNKLRITGGEPLLRQELPKLIAMLASVEGVDDLALTTNGAYLAAHAQAMKEAGLTRVTVSLDSLDPARFAQLSGRRDARLQTVLEGMEAAAAAGLPVKVNMVVQKGVNDDELLPMLGYCRERGYILRFIEFMDVGNLNDWNMARVTTAKEIVARVRAAHPCQPAAANYPGEVARRWLFRDGGEFGVIASVTQPFCGACSRARLSAEGKLYTCLFAADGLDLRAALRGDDDGSAVRRLLSQVWRDRADRYSELRGRAESTVDNKVEMFRIGG